MRVSPLSAFVVSASFLCFLPFASATHSAHGIRRRLVDEDHASALRSLAIAPLEPVWTSSVGRVVTWTVKDDGAPESVALLFELPFGDDAPTVVLAGVAPVVDGQAMVQVELKDGDDWVAMLADPQDYSRIFAQSDVFSIRRPLILPRAARTTTTTRAKHSSTTAAKSSSKVAAAAAAVPTTSLRFEVYTPTPGAKHPGKSSKAKVASTAAADDAAASTTGSAKSGGTASKSRTGIALVFLSTAVGLTFAIL